MFLAIDLKSYYASVECALRGLDPFTTNLVVADKSRGGGSIVLAATPCIKSHGASSRCRIYELPKNVYPIYARPRMNKYIETSSRIYSIYLRYVSKDDIHVYSIDEAFLDVTHYMKYYQISETDLSKKIMDSIYRETKITATCGIGENMFLAKVALDVLAKHEDDHIGYLTEALFKEKIWNHEPITDIWGIAKGISKRLRNMGINNMGELASYDEKKLEENLGVIGEEIYQHAHGKDDSTIEEIHNFVPENKSLGNGQVFFEDYSISDCYKVLTEMTYRFSLDLVEKKVVCSNILLFVGYSKNIMDGFCVQTRLFTPTNSYRVLMEELKSLYFNHVENYPIRNIGIRGGGIKKEEGVIFDLFTDNEKQVKEKKLYETIVELRKKFGKNAINKAISLDEKATLIRRNGMVGGHNAY